MKRIPTPSAAFVLAAIALFVALGGTGYAVLRLPAKSVGTVQIKNKAVTQPKLANKAVKAANVASDALTGAQIDEGTLGEVPSAGVAGLKFKSSPMNVPAGMVATATLACDPGLSAIAGGGEASHDARLQMIDSHPVAPSSWQVSIGNPTSQTFDGSAWVVCVKPAPGAGAMAATAAAPAHMSFRSLERP